MSNLLSRARVTVPLLALVISMASAGAQVINISGNVADGGFGPFVAGPVYRAVGNVTVPAGQTLTIQPGAIIKFGLDTTFFVDGTLVANGTSGQPITFTSEVDDSIGGDTNGGGLSVGTPNYWRGLQFSGSSTGTLQFATIRFGGRNGAAGVELNNGTTIAISNSTITSMEQACLDLNSSSTMATITNCAFNSSSRAVDGASINSLAGFANNTASGNVGLDSISVSNGTVTGTATVPAAALINGVIVLDAPLTVPASTTLNVAAGVIFKVRAIDITISVAGTIHCMGTAGQGVVFTEISDDSFAGDTNKNGPSGTGGNFWRGMSFTGGSLSTMTHTTVRGAGRNSFAGIEVFGGNVAASNCTVSACQQAGLDLNDQVTPSTFTNCAFNTSSRAVEGVRLDHVPSFANCTAAGNAVHDSLSLSSANISSNVAIVATNQISGAILVPVGMNIGSGSTLTVGQGVIFKCTVLDLTHTVSGALVSNGTPGAPVVFTTILDDAHAGDTGKDGATVVGPNYWRGFVFPNSSGPNFLTNTRIRGGGRNTSSTVSVSGGNVTMTNCVIDNSQQAAMSLNSLPATVTVTGTAFNSSNRAVEGMSLATLQGFTNNTAAGNAGHDSINITVSGITGNPIITSANMLNGCVLISPGLNLAAGNSLTLEAGVVFKMVNLDVTHTIDGTLTCLGTFNDRVAFTTISDDSFAGDTDENGATSVGPNFWRGLVFTPNSGSSYLQWTSIRGGGRNSGNEVSVASNITMQDCVVDFSQQSGISVVSGAQPAIRDTTVANCIQNAIVAASFASLRNMVDNTAAGNGGNFVHVTSGTVGVDDHVFAHNAPNRVVALTSSVAIAPGNSLTLHQGVIIKHFSLDLSWIVGGSLNLLGTAFDPVVLSTSSDDQFGGDSDNNGATVVGPNFWRGVTYPAGAPSTVEHAYIRGAGRNSSQSFLCQSPVTSIKALRVDAGQTSGISLAAAAGDVTNCVVSGHNSNGIVLTGGSFDLVHATVTGCAGTGVVRSGAGWTGIVRNTISRGNGGGGFSGTFTTSNMMFSDGLPALAGMAGNIDADPLFVNAAAGDFRLQAGSPCLGAADPTLTLQLFTDAAEGSRWLDANLDGTVLPDMGAYERTNWSLVVQGEPRTTATQTYTLTGNSFGLGVIVVGTGSFVDFFNDYGFLTAGHRTTVLPIAVLTTDVPFPVTIPGVPALEGFHYEIQGLVVSAMNTTRGNFTERYRATIYN